MLKKLIKLSSFQEIQAPTKYSTMHNNLLYYATQSNIPVVISSDIQSDENLNIFVDRKLVTKDNVYLLVGYSLAINPLLKVLDFTGESYASSKELSHNKAMLKLFLSRRGIPVPEFTVGLPLDSGYPCLIRKSNATSSNDLCLVKTEDEMFDKIENLDSPVVEKIIGLDKDISLTYMVWTYFYKPIAIIAEIVRDYETFEDWVIPDKQNVFYIPLFPMRSINLENFKTLRAKDINTYHPEYVSDSLTIAEINKVLQAFSMDEVPFLYESNKNSIVFNQKKMWKWSVFNLAEATSKILKLGFCRVDIKLDIQKAPHVLDVVGYTGYQVEQLPFHLLFKYSGLSYTSKSELIWHMIHRYYNLFGKFGEPNTLPEGLEE